MPAVVIAEFSFKTLELRETRDEWDFVMHRRATTQQLTQYESWTIRKIQNEFVIK